MASLDVYAADFTSITKVKAAVKAKGGTSSTKKTTRTTKTTKKVSTVHSGSGSTTTKSANSGVVKANGGLHVRSGPSTKYKILGTLANGSSINILEEKSGWYKILYNKTYGWVCAAYIVKSSTKSSSSSSSKTTTVTKEVKYAYAPGIKYLVYDKAKDPMKAVSSVSKYAPSPFETFDMPGYTKAKLMVHTYTGSAWEVKVFEFVIGPNSMTKSDANTITPLKTGNGYIIMRSGRELTRVGISGYFLDTAAVDERRIFLEQYYKKYLVDQTNAFNEYFNENRAYLEVEGYRYGCVLQGLELGRSSNSMFLFSYNMILLITSEQTIGNVAASEIVYQDPMKLSDTAGSGSSSEAKFLANVADGEPVDVLTTSQSNLFDSLNA